MPSNNFGNYKKYPCESIKIPPTCKVFFFFLSPPRLILFLHCTITIKKLKKTLVQQAINILIIWGAKKVFSLLKSLSKVKKALSQLF